MHTKPNYDTDSMINHIISNPANIVALVNALQSNPMFIEAIRNITQNTTTTDDGSNIINGRQAKYLLGGISDRTLSNYRRRYPEMIAGEHSSRCYYRDVVLRIAQNKKRRI